MSKKVEEPELMPAEPVAVRQPEQPMPVALRNDTGQVMGMMQTLVNQGVTAESAAAMREMVALYKEVRAMDAEQQYNVAFVKLQKEMPKVVAVRPVYEKGSQTEVRYKFAPLEDIMDQIRPHLEANGFAVSFDQDFDSQNKKLYGICILTHIGGHKTQNKFGVSYSAPPGTSPAQGDGSTGAYAQRYALCAKLNITISKLDDDGRLHGVDEEYITPEQAKSFETRLKAAGKDPGSFLGWAGAPSFDKIPKHKYEELNRGIVAAENAAKAKAKA